MSVSRLVEICCDLFDVLWTALAGHPLSMCASLTSSSEDGNGRPFA